jgi:CHAD domain-containing protein
MPEGMKSEHPSRAYHLKRGEPLGEGMRRIAAGRAETALERLRGVGSEDPEFPEAVHGARKDLKKLRAVVRLLRDQLGETVYEQQNRCYRDAGRALSESRDAKVKLETLDRLAERRGDLPASALGAWRQGLERDRDQTLGGTDEMTVLEAIELIEAGRDGIEAWRLESGSWKLIDSGVLRTYGKGRRAMRRAEAEPSEENFHRWRKRVKDLWYLLRILCPAWPEVLGASAGEAHQLAELLGDHHDLAVLRADLATRSFPGEESAPLAEAIAARERELADAAFELGHRLYAEKPKVFRRRIRAFWRAWRES